jgi:hypothetical protein
MDHGTQPYGTSLGGGAVPSPPLDSENQDLLKDAADKKQANQRVGEALSKRLLKLSNDIEAIDREKRLRLVRSMIKAHQYMDGNFFGYVDSNLEWVQINKGPDEVWYVDNQVYPYWRTALMELSRTQTEVIVNPSVEGDEEMEAAAKFAKARYDANRDRTFNARLKQTENAYALLNGITFRYTFPQFSRNARSEKIPVIKKNEKTEPGESMKICSLCLRPKQDLPDVGEGKAPDKCLKCGSDMFNEYSMNENPETVIGYEELPNCKNAWIVPNPASIIVSMSASCVRESKFLKWKQMVLRSVLQERYKDLELPSTGIKSLELGYISDQQRATPASNQTGSGGRGSLMYDDSPTASRKTDQNNDLEELEFHQVWLDYELYCNWTFEDDMPLANGKTLKAGKPLGSAYPDGLWYATEADIVLDMWNEDKNRKWSSSPYGMRPGSMYGTGSSVAMSDQDLLNDLRRLKMANAWANGVPREFVDPDRITELSADPQIPTVVKKDDAGAPIIGGAYAVVPPMPLSQEIYALTDNAKSDLQNKVGALSGTGDGGLADTKQWGNTATAITMKRDLAVGRFSPDLALMADELDKEQAYQFLENEQQYFTPQDWEKLKGSFGEAAVEKFCSLNLREDLNISIVDGSYMPKSDAQMQSKLMAYIAQALPVLMQANNPELTAFASETFGIPEHIGGWSTDRASTNRLIQRFTSLCQAFIEQHGDAPTNDLSPVPSGQMGPDGQPVMVESPTMKAAKLIDQYASMPVDVFLDNHQAIQEALRDWRTSDEGQEASNLLLATVALRYSKHQAGIAQQQQIMARTAQAGTQPLQDEAEAKQNEAAQMAAAANAKAEETANDDKKLQIAGQLAEFHDKDAEREQKSEMQDKELASKERIKQMELDAQKAKAKSAG